MRQWPTARGVEDGAATANSVCREGEKQRQRLSSLVSFWPVVAHGEHMIPRVIGKGLPIGSSCVGKVLEKHFVDVLKIKYIDFYWFICRYTLGKTSCT